MGAAAPNDRENHAVVSVGTCWLGAMQLSIGSKGRLFANVWTSLSVNLRRQR